MSKEEALKILVEVAELAQSKGILSLKDAVFVLQAIESFIEKQEPPEADAEQ